MAPQIPDLELIYFPVKVRAETSRYALSIAGLPFKNTIVDRETFATKLKGTDRVNPFGQLPLLIIDGKERLSQSNAIHRYIGKLTDLYPSSDGLRAARVDEFMYAAEDMLVGLFRARGEAARKEWMAGAGPRAAAGLEEMAKANATSEVRLVGDTLTIADLAVYCLVQIIRSGFLDYADGSVFDKSPKLLAVVDAVAKQPKVVEYNKDHPWAHEA